MEKSGDGSHYAMQVMLTPEICFASKLLKLKA